MYLIILLVDPTTISFKPDISHAPRERSSQILYNSPLPGERRVRVLHDSQIPGVKRAQVLHDLCAKHNISDIELGRSRTKGIYKQNTIYKYLVVDDSNKSVYCSISKCASTAWKYALVQMHGGGDRNGMNVHDHKYLEAKGLGYLFKYSKEEAEYRMKHYFKYIITRHPFDRLVSGWRNKVGEKNKRLTHSIRAASRLKGEETAELEADRPIDFSEFLKYIARKNPLNFNRHWLSLYHHCHPCHFRYDFVAKVETLSADLPHLYNALHVDKDIQLRVINNHSKHSPHFSTYYNPVMTSTHKQLCSLYHVDMTLFNYTYPICS